MKINIITGGSRGLGRSMALNLADKGQDSIITYHSRKADADAVVKEIAAKGRKAVALQLDVAKSSGFDAFAADVKKAWRNMEARQLRPSRQQCRHRPSGLIGACGRDRVRRDDGHSSKGAVFPDAEAAAVDGGWWTDHQHLIRPCALLVSRALGLCMMKGGIEVFTRYLAKELGARSITANTLAPGAIATDFGGGLVRDNPQFNAQIAGQTRSAASARRTISAPLPPPC